MAVPDFQSLMRPVLAVVGSRPTATRTEVREALAAEFRLSPEDVSEVVPSGTQTVLANRVGWSLTYLAQAGLITRPARGVYVITQSGRDALVAHPERIDTQVLGQYPQFQAFKTGSAAATDGDSGGNSGGKLGGADTGGGAQYDVVPTPLTPTEEMERLLAEANDAVAAELLDRIIAEPPAFLERLSLRVLGAMGYGGRESLIHTGKSGDGGLDGLIRQDALGLDLVGVQAKRYDRDATVTRPEIQAFVGALQGAQTSRGVFVTTASFSLGARKFAEQVSTRLVLIDGRELTRLMVRYNVGVSVRATYALKAVDSDFFDDAQ